MGTRVAANSGTFVNPDMKGKKGTFLIPRTSSFETRIAMFVLNKNLLDTWGAGGQTTIGPHIIDAVSSLMNGAKPQK